MHGSQKAAPQWSEDHALISDQLLFKIAHIGRLHVCACQTAISAFSVVEESGVAPKSIT